MPPLTSVTIAPWDPTVRNKILLRAPHAQRVTLRIQTTKEINAMLAHVDILVPLKKLKQKKKDAKNVWKVVFPTTRDWNIVQIVQKDVTAMRQDWAKRVCAKIATQEKLGRGKQAQMHQHLVKTVQQDGTTKTSANFFLLRANLAPKVSIYKNINGRFQKKLTQHMT